MTGDFRKAKNRSGYRKVTTRTVKKSRLEQLKENKLSKVKNSKLAKRKILMKKIGKIALIFLGFFLIILTIGGIRVLAYLQELNDGLPTPEKVFPDLPVASEIYDRKAIDTEDGTRLYRLFNEYNSDPVDIAQIPETVKWAFLAAEDSDFYNHNGFDAAAIIRCGLAYVRESGNVCGGSTVTQQLVKITAPGIGNEVRLERKIRELLLALKVDEVYDKDQILEMYLRVAPFGANIYGVKTAANFYFGKEPKDLSLAEATTLSSIIQDPVRLSPTLSQDPTGLERLRERQLYVLSQMEEKMQKINDQVRTNNDNPEMDDVLTLEMIEAARAEELAYKPPSANLNLKAGHFVNYVLQELQKKNYKNGTEPFTLEELQKGGYKIYTTLDYGIQQIAESFAEKAGSDYKYWNMNNAAVMTVTPSNGEVIAMAGSKSFYAESEGCDSDGKTCKFNPQVNIMTSLQSPGSTNKPLGYYLAYKEGKMFTSSVLPDVPIKITDVNGQLYEPKNWNGGFTGIQTAEKMLRDSRNLPAISVIQMVGVNNYLETAKSWGYTSYTGQYGQSVILGGADVYPVEHVQAYSVFANNGDLVNLNPILKIMDKDGKEIYSAASERKAVGDQQAVFLLNQSLKNLNGFSWDQRDLAAKTGTSEDSKDAWLMVWSPDFITLGWGGNNNNEPMDRNYGYPPYVIQPWLQNYMRDIGEAPYFSAKTPFTRPGFVYEGGGDCNDNGECLGLSKGWLINDRNPQRDVIKKKAVVCKDQQDRLARPIDIATDNSMEKEFNYYKMPVAAWQGQLDSYLKSKDQDNILPTENCNINRTGDETPGPFFAMQTPGDSTVISGNSINVRGSVFTTEGNINSLSFTLDNQPLGSSNQFENFDLTLNLSGNLNNLENGTYTFKAIATDSNGLNETYTVSIIMKSETTSNLVFQSIPVAGPGNVTVKYNGSNNLNTVQLYQVKTVGSNAPVTTLVGTMSAGGGNTYNYNWNGTGSGSYRFFVTANINSSTGKIKSNQSNAVIIL
jgi:penicillin-binding protein 1A